MVFPPWVGWHGLLGIIASCHALKTLRLGRRLSRHSSCDNLHYLVTFFEFGFSFNSHDAPALTKSLSYHHLKFESTKDKVLKVILGLWHSHFRILNLQNIFRSPTFFF